MFRNLLRTKSIFSNSLFKTKMSHHTKAEKDTFMKAWSKLPESSRKLTAIQETKPDFAEILLYKGHAYKEIGEWESAITSYKEAAELDSDYAEKACREIEEIQRVIKSFNKRQS